MSGSRFQEAVRSLSGPELAELIGVLGGAADENGVSGELLGLCLVEAVGRLVETQDGKTQDLREEEDFTAEVRRTRRNAEEEGGLQ